MSSEISKWTLPNDDCGTSYFKICPSRASRACEAVGVCAIAFLGAWAMCFLLIDVGLTIAIPVLIVLGVFAHLGSKNGWFKCGLQLSHSYTDSQAMTESEPERVIDQFELKIKGHPETIHPNSN